MKAAALVLAILTTVGAWGADALLLGVPLFRNTWLPLTFFLVPLVCLLAAKGVEGKRKLRAAAWVVFVLGTGTYAAVRGFVGNLEGSPAVAVGDVAPNFMLKDTEGKDVRLSDLSDQGRVLLLFFRGHYFLMEGDRYGTVVHRSTHASANA